MATTALITKQRDEWLSGVFQQPVYRWLIPNISADSSAVTEDCLAFKKGINDGPVFCYIKLPTTAISLLSTLCQQGFHVVDANLTYQRAGHTEPPVTPKRFTIRSPVPEEQASIERIASSCFVYSRFHLDPMIPSSLANEIKRQWIANYLNKKRGESLWIAQHHDRPVGFLALLAEKRGTQSIRIVDLIGVDPSIQGQGVGRALLNWLIHDSRGAYDQLQAGTQLSNTAAIRLYESLGFRLHDSTYVLHAHFQGPGGAS